MKTFAAIAVFAMLVQPVCAGAFMSEKDIASRQNSMTLWSTGQKIAAWAESFVGTPYDTDPQGEYVTRSVIVADDRVDCMYHVFRSVELALSDTPDGAVEVALRKRFRTQGLLGQEGRVLNYSERFEYGMDMIASGRWGRDATKDILGLSTVEGARGYGEVSYLEKKYLGGALPHFESGDIVYFLKAPEKRAVGEIVGHMGIIMVEGREVYLIHASGSKGKGGAVVKVPLAEYVGDMGFIGLKITRF